MPEKKRKLVTAALPYANGPLHIGHIAGCYLPSDIYVRYQRLLHNDVLFICGSDEHGVPITIRAKKEGVTPQEIVDKYHGIMKKAFEDFGISFDIYSRTSSKNHHETSQEIFLELYNKGVFNEETTEQYFDEKANQFLADRYIIGTCPKCQNPNAYGDQCERCGSTLSPQELINPHSALSGNKPVLKKTKNWYLPLDALQDKLNRYIDAHQGDWKINVYGQCKSWLNQGLQPRAMTRDLDWGVKVPVKETDGKVMYVWFDAPIGYISFTKELKPDNWQDYWQSEDSEIIHFIGKDNIVFHCIIFPAVLMCTDRYKWATNVPANEFLNLEGDKISTSRNHAVWLHEYLIDFPGKTDELRYVLTSIAPETKDADFTWKDYQLKVNSELVSILGNFVNRVMVLSHKFYGGKTPDAKRIKAGDNITYVTAFDKMTRAIDASIGHMKSHLNNFRFRDAQSEMMNIARAGNLFLTETEPWKLQKTDEGLTKNIMHDCLNVAVNIAFACAPFLPETHKNIIKQLNISGFEKDLGYFWTSDGGFMHYFGIEPPGNHTLNAAELLFKNIEDDAINHQLDKLQKTKMENEAAAKSVPPVKAEITFDDFSRMDIRVGQIMEAEKVKGADKLLQLKIDTGNDQRTVVSGIAQHYKPEEIVGKKVSILVNLAPRKIKGIESHGMILLAEDKNGKLTFVLPEDNDKENGSVVR
ncbi:MAG TPA: methionine--tRNA ligase [Flavobacteriales bacterium]|nr:methionine--tRNA ligase [Flavobacteriales bacterium]